LMVMAGILEASGRTARDPESIRMRLNPING
jgi:hypothetical protein